MTETAKGSRLKAAHSAQTDSGVAVCEETYSWSSGTFQSPSYPDSYGSRKQCTYILQQWEGYVVTLQFTDFNLGDSTDCQGQYIEVWCAASYASFFGCFFFFFFFSLYIYMEVILRSVTFFFFSFCFFAF